MIYVIGSGAAGVSAAKALLARNVAVTMLDVGIQLEADKKNKLDEFKQTRQINTLYGLQHALCGDDHMKFSYGSDYVYRGTETFLNAHCSEQVLSAISFAQGGLSNVWGAFVMPYSESELKNWPIAVNQLSIYYKKITGYMPLAIGECNPAKQYPLYTDHALSYQHSEQAKVLLNTLQKNSVSLNDAGFEFGSARLAVNFNQCTYCGLCQHGCPNQLIYSARDTLTDLLKNKNFNYVKNVVVSHWTENENGVTIYANDFITHQLITFQATQVFLAAGAIASTKMLLTSLKLYHTPVTLQDSQHFMIPALTYRAVKNVKAEKLHTLAQLYLKVSHSTFLKNPAHFQVYTYMDHYENKFKQLLRFAYPILNPMLNRMIVLQGLLDSADSAGCEISLIENNKMQITQKNRNDSKAKIKKIEKRLWLNRKKLGFIPLTFLSQISKILRSYHYGGSFPMSITQTQTTTDLLGRPFQSKRVHVVDATIFPGIPAGAITFSVMANAYRIASECEIL